MKHVTIKDIEPLVPFSRGSTEIFLTGHWSSKKPSWTESTSPCRQACPIGNDIARAFSYAGRGAIDEALHLFRQNNPFPGYAAGSATTRVRPTATERTSMSR